MALGKWWKKDKPADVAPPPRGESILTSTMIDAERVGDAAFVRARCEKITERECHVLLAELDTVGEKTGGRIALDLSEVMMLASAGIGALVQVHKRCADQGGGLVVCGLSDELLELLRVAHLDRLLNIRSSRQQALEALP